MHRLISKLACVACSAALAADITHTSVQAATPDSLRGKMVSPLAPRVDEVDHLGVQRGVSTELNCRGSGLSGHPRLFAPFRFTEARQPGTDNTSFTTAITVDAATPLGIYPVRVLTDEGLSDPFPLAIGQLPQVQEQEGDWTLDTAPLLTAPVVVEGRLSLAKDMDLFRIHGRKGQRILIEPQMARIGSRFDPVIDLISMHRELRWSSSMDSGRSVDAPLFAVLPRDDDYGVVLGCGLLPIKGGRPDYRLVVGELPATNRVYPLGGRRGETIRVELWGGTLLKKWGVPVTLQPASGESVVRIRATTDQRGPGGALLDIESLPPLVVDDLPERLEPASAQSPPLRATPPVVINARLGPPYEDRFTLDVTPGQRLRVEVAAVNLGSAFAATLEVLDGRGTVLSDAKSVMVPARAPVPEYGSLDPACEFFVPQGQREVTIHVDGRSMIPRRPPPLAPVGVPDLSGAVRVGYPYRIKVVPVVPEFELSLADSQINVPRGSTAAIGVSVRRIGFSGPIALRVSDPPAGLTFRSGAIPERETLGAFTVSAAADVAPGPVILDVVGEGQGPDGPVVAHASRIIAFGPITTEPIPKAKEFHEGVLDDLPAYLRTRIMTQPGLFVTAVRPAPVAFDAPVGPVNVVQGLSATFQVKATRAQGAEGSLTLSPLSLPPGMSISNATLDQTATEATITVEAAADHPPGKVSIVLIARGKVEGLDRNLAIPAVMLQVVGPADADRAMP